MPTKCRVAKWWGAFDYFLLHSFTSDPYTPTIETRVFDSFCLFKVIFFFFTIVNHHFSPPFGHLGNIFVIFSNNQTVTNLRTCKNTGDNELVMCIQLTGYFKNCNC